MGFFTGFIRYLLFTKDGRPTNWFWLLFAVVVIVVCSLFAGCANINNHKCNANEVYPFCGTASWCGIMSEVFSAQPDKHGGSAGEAGIAHAYAVLLFPLIVIDLPFEVAADVVTLPYDVWWLCARPPKCGCDGVWVNGYDGKYHCKVCYGGGCIGDCRCRCKCEPGKCKESYNRGK